MNKCVWHKFLKWIGKECLKGLQYFVPSMLIIVIVIGISVLLSRFNINPDDAFMICFCAPSIIVIALLVLPISIYVNAKKKLQEIKLECMTEEKNQCQNGNS